MQVMAQQDDNLDLLIYRHLGNSAGLLEQTLILNPGISATAILAHGTIVNLPDKQSQPAINNTVQLWT
ncbi:tail protein X [Aggregatibacter actinomycetemcomitans]|uniref:tail protein X n=1 Tax=Aggregatibacter actinomycetemcomitans TaxID=714 RepID=UPI00197C0852|nr:tail protein X [Aggregatibacter actinomycetemcomitans]MBN6079887.1 tail protein X [Aggregatibacter actinomycetemcomitans]